MMLSAEPEILPYRAQDKNAVLALSLRAWQPVFAEMRRTVPAFVYHNFYPAGWEKRQLADLGTFLDEEAERVWLAWRGGQPVGWVGIRLHPEDNMGEIYVLAVDPACQRQDIGRHLMTHAFAAIRAAGMAMVMWKPAMRQDTCPPAPPTKPQDFNVGRSRDTSRNSDPVQHRHLARQRDARCIKGDIHLPSARLAHGANPANRSGGDGAAAAG